MFNRQFTFIVLLLLALTGAVRAQVVINEFVAENGASATDEDGAHPDWIELLNTTAGDVNLDGWWLSDDAAVPMKWRIPAATIAGRGYLLIFASGKDRTATLHTNFQLNNAGESVILSRPDGSVASQFLNYPAQREDIGYGTAREVLAGNLVQFGSAAKALIPTNGTLGSTWTQAGFTDSAWQSGTAGAGYDIGGASLGLLLFYDFNNATNSAQANDLSGNSRHGVVEGGAIFTGVAGGRTGLGTDRAMNFPNTGFNRVRVASAATGALDSITSADAVSVSVWIFGDSAQPQPDSLFYADNTSDGTGSRVLNAHVPWTDQVVYWDCGGFNPGQRISVSVPDSTKWKGQWNHYVFTKGNGALQVWLNGALLITGASAPGMSMIRSLFLGHAPWGAYGGKMDDFAVWNRALTSEEIVALSQGASPLNMFGFTSSIGTNLLPMRGVNATAYTRFPFTFSGVPDFDSLMLRIKYEDGFIAYLNGLEITRRNAPAVPQWNSLATVDRSRADGLIWVPLEVPGAASQLVQGTNVLAIQALNENVSSNELLILPELTKTRTATSRFLKPATAGTPNSTGSSGFVADIHFTVNRGWFSAPFSTTVTSATPDATLSYTLDGSAPALTNGTLVTPPSATINITGTTTLRAAAFKTDMIATNVDTQTYLFAAQVATQPAAIPGWPATWPTGHPGDYQMDPDVTGSTLPGYGISDALLSIPTISVVGKLSDLVTLYGASSYTGSLQAPELPSVAVSAEWIDPSAALTNWQEDCAFNIHGNISRSKDFTPKHGFSLNFSGDYGARSLNQDVFPGSGATKFDQLVLKSLSTDTWPCSDAANSVIDGDTRWKRAESTYLRDEVFRATHLAVSGTSARGRYAHLFINGVYWGLINVIEHLDNQFASEHFGGARAEWDVVKDYNELSDGSRADWDALLALAGTSGFSSESVYQQAQGNNPDGTRNLAFPVLLDVQNLIDYMIVHIAQGADDWPDKNWYGMRRRTDPNTGFKFFSWDQEISNNSILKQHSANGPMYELVDQAGRPAQIYSSARLNAGFKRKFGDRVQSLFFNGGPLTQSAMSARWNAHKAMIDKAIVAESARWADYQRATPFKREVEWLSASAWMDSTYWPQFVSRALIRFRNAAVYPSFNAPAFNQHGGNYSPGFSVSISHNNGSGYTTYYTVNNTDPSVAGSPTYTVPFTISGITTVRTRVRNNVSGEWSAMTSATFQPAQGLALLALTELCYNPPGVGAIDGDEFEFIELQNTGAATLDLTACAFTDGVAFTFQNGTQIAPGAFIVIARNPTIFATRFPGVTALGPYTGRLDNDGETLTLSNALAQTIWTFTYGVIAPWPSSPSGSLHFLSGALNSEQSWFAGASTPGTHPADADGDDASNLAEQAAGTNAGDPASIFKITAIVREAGGTVTCTFPGVAGKTYRVQTSSDLSVWTTLGSNITATTTGPQTFTDSSPAPRYYRVRTPAP